MRKIEAENDRLRGERNNTERDHRQSNYHQLLTWESELRALRFSGSYYANKVDAAAAQFNRYAQGVILFGTEASRRAAEELRQGWEAKDPNAMIAAREKLVEATRADVAPD
jgi:hypothetical protein